MFSFALLSPCWVHHGGWSWVNLTKSGLDCSASSQCIVTFIMDDQEIQTRKLRGNSNNTRNAFALPMNCSKNNSSQIWLAIRLAGKHAKYSDSEDTLEIYQIGFVGEMSLNSYLNCTDKDSSVTWFWYSPPNRQVNEKGKTFGILSILSYYSVKWI